MSWRAFSVAVPSAWNPLADYLITRPLNTAVLGVRIRHSCLHTIT